MQEIGSEFWKVETGSKPCLVFPARTQWYLSGRSALQAIIQELRWARSVSMPAWCCDSMVKPFIDAGIKVRFYPVYPESGLKQEIDTDADVLFIMDYFGYSNDRDIKHPCIIRDVTHSIFSRDYQDADYYFGSLRKWSGVWTGGYAWTKDGHMLPNGSVGGSKYISLRSDAMKLKNCYINELTKDKGQHIIDKHYLQVYEEAEDELENIGIAPASVRDVEFAGMLDVDYMRQARRSNAEVLMKAFVNMLLFPQLKDGDCPMFVPILVPGGKRDVLRRYLINNEIYCPVHWPISKYHDLDERTNELYKNELSLVCDQRYFSHDMDRIVDAISRFMGD